MKPTTAAAELTNYHLSFAISPQHLQPLPYNDRNGTSTSGAKERGMSQQLSRQTSPPLSEHGNEHVAILNEVV
jgi:hypothetical protein